MECSATRLIPSAQVVQLLLIDPVLITVTRQSITAQGKTVNVDGDILAARVCGRDKFIIYGTDGFLRLFGLDLTELQAKKVGLPSKELMLMSANAAGDTVALRNGTDILSIYRIDAEIVYIGSTPLAENASSCQVVKGVPGSPGILVIFAGVCASLIEISKTCPVISTIRISHNPVMDVLPLAREGDYLVLTCNKARIFALRDILVGRFEVPVIKLPAALSCASSTRLKDGSITNVAICGGRLYQLEQNGPSLNIDLVCRHQVLNQVQFFYLIPGPVTLVHWTTPSDSGRFIIDEDNHTVDLEPEVAVNYASGSFIQDSCVLSFGANGVTALSQSLSLNQLAEVATDSVCDMFYEPESEELFIVYSTCTSIVSINRQKTGVEFREKELLEGQVLAVGANSDKRVIVFRDSIRVGDETVPTEPTGSAVVVQGQVVMATLGNEIRAYNICAQSNRLLVQSAHQVSFVSFAGGLYYGTTEPALYKFTLDGASERVTLRHGGVPESVASGEQFYVSFRDGKIESNSQITCLDVGPILLKAFGNRILAYGRGVWLVDRLISRLTCDQEKFTTAHVGSVCVIPYFDLSVIVAHNDKLHMLSTTHIQQPLVKPVMDKSIIALRGAQSYRCWVAAAERELLFIDTKRLSVLNCSSDLTSTITAMNMWNIKLNNHTYSHVLLGTEHHLQFAIRSLSIKRERNCVYARKRLKLMVNSRVDLIHPIEDGALVARGQQLGLLRVGDTGLSLKDLGSFEGNIQDISFYKGSIFLSTTSGLVRLSFDQLLYDPNCMVNRMRACVCHVCCEFEGKDYVVSAEKDCFINIYEIGESRRWKLSQRLQSAKRVVRMQQVRANNIPKDAVVIIALTSTGSFIEIKLGAAGLHLGPYF